MNKIDEEGLIDEPEEGSIGNKHILINRLACLLSLLLTEHFQPHKRGHTLHYKIKEQRIRARLYLEDNSSLKTKVQEILSKAYTIAVPKVLHETGLRERNIPPLCPYSFDQVMDDTFYPEEQASVSF